MRPVSLEESELRIERHLASLLALPGDGEGAPMPSLRLIQAPVFHGYSFSAWVEFVDAPDMEALESSLSIDSIEVRGGDFEPPTNVGQAGQGGIAVGAITPDRNHPDAVWFWFVADNVRLAAENAVAVVRQICMSRFVLRPLAFALAALTGCGYHVSGHGDLMPKTIKTIAIPAFGNTTIALQAGAHCCPTDIAPRIALAHALQDRRRSQSGRRGPHRHAPQLRRLPHHLRRTAAPPRWRPSSRCKVTLTNRATGAVLFNRPGAEFRERYEISDRPHQPTSTKAAPPCSASAKTSPAAWSAPSWRTSR